MRIVAESRELARALVVATIVAAIAVAPASQARAAVRTIEVRGTAAYRERLTMPPDAVFEATLEDISRADAKAEVIATVHLERPRTSPIRFKLVVDASRIDPRHAYAVRAHLTIDGRVRFTTDRAYRVLTGGYGPDATMLLRAVEPPREVGGPANGGAGAPAGPDAGPLGRLPATFAGTLPCADCMGIHYTLRLFPEGAFYLRTTYLRSGEDVSQYDIGGWTFSSDRTSIVLRGGREAPLLFALKSASALRKLDLDGREVASTLPYELRRVPDAESFEPRLLMRGTYSMMADAATFTECSTGQHWPVAQEADNVALERAYGVVRRRPGESVLVSVEGRLALRPKMEGDGLEPALVVEHFIKAFPSETCGARFSSAALEGTHWRLVQLADEPVLGPPRFREAFIVFDSKAHRFSGSGGCNRLTGGYEVNGAALRVPKVGATRMACAVGMEIEQGLVDALGKTRTWRVIGQHLDVYAEGGALLARFEATAAK
jgi:uncharacterized lipoprotein YbaY/heat shock protein HslJ/uncharacterized lipoprotein NlpE involved in copper resistance